MQVASNDYWQSSKEPRLCDKVSWKQQKDSVIPSLMVCQESIQYQSRLRQQTSRDADG